MTITVPSTTNQTGKRIVEIDAVRGFALCGIHVVVVGVVLPLIRGQLIAGYGVMPGLLVIGLALARFGVHRRLGSHTGVWAGATLLFGAITAAYWWTVWAGIELPRLSFGLASLPEQLAGVAGGLFYASLLVLLMRLGLRRVLGALFAPMGRMALTNYLAATVLILVFSPLLGIRNCPTGRRSRA